MNGRGQLPRRKDRLVEYDVVCEDGKTLTTIVKSSLNLSV